MTPITSLRIARELADPPPLDELQLMFDRGYRQGYAAGLRLGLAASHPSHVYTEPTCPECGHALTAAGCEECGG